jgi:hypothetical protein
VLDEVTEIRRARAVGVVLDVSLKHDAGERRIDLAKRAVADALTRHLHVDDPVYVTTDADRDGLPVSRGEGLARMWDFEIPPGFDAPVILGHTIERVTDIPGVERRDVIYVTDRLTPFKAGRLVAALGVAARQEYPVRVGIFDIGSPGRETGYAALPDFASGGPSVYLTRAGLLADPEGNSISDYLTLE